MVGWVVCRAGFDAVAAEPVENSQMSFAHKPPLFTMGGLPGRARRTRRVEEEIVVGRLQVVGIMLEGLEYRVVVQFPSQRR